MELSHDAQQRNISTEMNVKRMRERLEVPVLACADYRIVGRKGRRLAELCARGPVDVVADEPDTRAISQFTSVALVAGLGP